MGSLKITGVLDDVEDSSINGYGTYDVFINGELDESGCTSYNKQWPRGTSYEIRNIQPNGGKSYTSLVSGTLSGNITSMTDLQVVLGFESDRIATPEWQTAKSLPGNLDPDMLDIEYSMYIRGKAGPVPEMDGSWFMKAQCSMRMMAARLHQMIRCRHPRR